MKEETDSIEKMVRESWETLKDGAKAFAYTMIPIKGQIYYVNHTGLPKSVSIVGVTALQLFYLKEIATRVYDLIQ